MKKIFLLIIFLLMTINISFADTIVLPSEIGTVQNIKYEDIVLEHIVPVASKGGTVLFNCIPTSKEVNGTDQKGAKHLIDWWTNSNYWNQDAPLRLEKIVNYMLDGYEQVFKEYTVEEVESSYLDIELFEEFVEGGKFTPEVADWLIEHGADIVIHSTSKYMDGHAVTLGGVVVDSGNFDWTCGKFPEFTEPDETYHGLIYTKDCGRAAFITKARVQLMRDYGVPLSPQNAFLLNLGLETLHLRMERHCSNALKVAEFLSKHPKISFVQYPGLEGDKYHDLANKYMPNGTCGVMAFGVKAGKAAAQRFMEHLRLAAMVVHVADARTCILHPASTTHRQLSDEQLRDSNITPELLRMSIGIEDVDDIIADIKQALEQI